MLRLRPFRVNDAKQIVTWPQDPKEFFEWSEGKLGEYPVSEQRLLKATSGRESNERYFPFVAFDEDGLVGFFTMRAPEDDKKVLFGYVIIAPSKRGRGYGKTMISQAIRFVFDIYGADSVNLDVFENNLAAVHCYRSIGFKDTGNRVEHIFNGNVWNEIEMELYK